MKKYLPLILVGIGILVVAVAGLVIMKSMKKAGSVTEEEVNVPELPESQWPAVTLTPTEDPTVPNSLGHFLDFKVQKVNVPGADSMDYLLVYTTSDGGQQGAPGTVKLTGGDIERKLLLGSASSGKYRFDAGVSTGTMTITFRNNKGKSMGKLTTSFHLQFNETVLTSVDGKFTYTLDKPVKGVFFVTMPTFIQPTDSMYVTWVNGYGVFASDSKPHTGK
ncbi:MAG TPA: hypothetical protein VKC54_02155 [Patescibacteria group bacterium]|nr:hypothetical protein [Patescibacteria group bacterium]